MVSVLATSMINCGYEALIGQHRIVGVMVSVLATSMKNCGYEPLSGNTVSLV